jgi:hypothetical protein
MKNTKKISRVRQCSIGTFLELSLAEKGKREDLYCFWEKCLKRGKKRRKGKERRRIIRGRKTKGRDGMLLL